MKNSLIRDFTPTTPGIFNLILINEIDDKLYLANSLIIKPIIYKFNILNSNQENFAIFDFQFTQLVYST